MFVLDEPYISDFLTGTINKNNYPVLKNKLVEKKVVNLIEDCDFRKYYRGKICTNSENTFERVLLNLPELKETIAAFKDKAKFRELIKSIYPDYFFKKVSGEQLNSMNKKQLNYPVVIKPNIGFLSVGVYTVQNEDEFDETIKKINESMEKSKGIFPENVLNADNFIIEEYIEGDEYAVDVYFDENGECVILNIFKHPFVNKNDVSDRMYITSSSIIKENLEDFSLLFNKIGKMGKVKNIPLHIELRRKGDKIIPVEINPLRFAGCGTADISYFAYGINNYEYYMQNKKPDWDEILKDNNSTYAFVIMEVPSFVNPNDIMYYDTEALIKDMKAEVLDIREFDYKKMPVFRVLFIKAESFDKIKHILTLKSEKYIKV